jgi:predicted transcriptional regulator
MDAPMPTRKARMALTLPDDVRDAINDLADAMAKPASAVVTHILQEMVPQLQGLAKVVRASNAGNKVAAKRALAHMMGDNLAAMMTATQVDMFKGKDKPKS